MTKHSDRKPTPSQLNLMSILVSEDHRRTITDADVHCISCADQWIRKYQKRRRR